MHERIGQEEERRAPLAEALCSGVERFNTLPRRVCVYSSSAAAHFVNPRLLRLLLSTAL